MEFFVGNLIVAGLSDWGCVLIPTGLPAELIPHKLVLRCRVPDDVYYYTSKVVLCQRLFLNFSRIICTNFRQGHASGFWGAGLCGWNCRHTFFALFPEPGDPPAWTREALKGLNVRNIEYNGKQYTRYEINRERSQQMYGDPETYLYMDPLKKN